MPSAKTSIVALIIAVLGVATAYLGNDKYQSSQVIVEGTDVITNVKITSLPAGAIRSSSDINAMIKTLVEDSMDYHVNDSGRH